MSFKEIRAFMCEHCSRVYTTLPLNCVCEKRSYLIGQIIGSFVLQTRPSEDGMVSVTCVLCGLTSEMHYTNMKRQVSCGCKPKHIKLEDVQAEITRYKCQRCRTLHTEANPIVTYCCEEED